MVNCVLAYYGCFDDHETVDTAKVIRCSGVNGQGDGMAVSRARR